MKAFYCAVLIAFGLQLPASCADELERVDFNINGIEATLSKPLEHRKHWGFIDHSGKFVIKPRFEFVTGFRDDSATVKDETGCYKIDKAGRKIGSLLKHSEVTEIKCLPWPPRHTYQGKIYDASGKKVLADANQVRLLEFSEGMASCTFRPRTLGNNTFERTGFINTEGRLVIPAIYRYAWGFQDGIAVVQMNDSKSEKFGFIDRSGKAIGKRLFDRAELFENGFGIVEIKNKEAQQFGFVDRSGKLLLGDWCEVKPFSPAGGAAVRSRDKLWGFIDRQGHIVVKPQFETISYRFSEGLSYVETAKGYGFVDENGKFVIAPAFSDVGNFSSGLAPAAVDVPLLEREKYLVHNQNWRCGFIDTTGKEVVKPIYFGAVHFSEGLAAVQDGLLWGFIDSFGKSRIAPQFEDATTFSQGLAAVMQHGKWGFINFAGHFEIAPSLPSEREGGDNQRTLSAPIAFSEGFTIAGLPDGRWHYLDRKGALAFSSLPCDGGGFAFTNPLHKPFSEGLAAVSADIRGSHFGYLTRQGVYAVEQKLHYAGAFSEGLAAVGVASGSKPKDVKSIPRYIEPTGVRYLPSIGFIDKELRFVVEPSYDKVGEFSEGLAAVAHIEQLPEHAPNHPDYLELPRFKERWGFVDDKGRLRIAQRFDSACSFSQGLAAIKVGEKWGFIDRTGEIVISPKYELARSFSDNLAAVKLGGKFGFIDKTGSFVVPPKYLLCGRFSNNRALVVVPVEDSPLADKKLNEFMQDASHHKRFWTGHR